MVDRIPPKKSSTKMTEIGSNECRLLRADTNAALALIAAKYGITIEIGKMTYSGTSVRMQIEAAVIAEGGIAMNRHARDFQQLAPLYGMEPDDLGKTFMMRGEEYRITGLSPRRSKMPILGERTRDGMGFKFPADGILRLLGRSTATKQRGVH